MTLNSYVVYSLGWKHRLATSNLDAHHEDAVSLLESSLLESNNSDNGTKNSKPEDNIDVDTSAGDKNTFSFAMLDLQARTSQKKVESGKVNTSDQLKASQLWIDINSVRRISPPELALANKYFITSNLKGFGTISTSIMS